MRSEEVIETKKINVLCVISEIVRNVFPFLRSH